MAVIERVELFTVPSTWTAPECDPTNLPYRRIVGLRRGNGMPEIRWSRVDGGIPAAAYSRTDTDLETVEMPVTLSKRLSRFFARFFVEPPRILQGDDPEETSEEYTNCHRFGLWMSGKSAAKLHEVPDDPEHIVLHGSVVNGSLAMGVHGVLGVRIGNLGYGDALHSVVGLGRDRDDCLQVTGSHGFIGLDTYENVFAHYDPDKADDLELYV